MVSQNYSRQEMILFLVFDFREAEYLCTTGHGYAEELSVLVYTFLSSGLAFNQKSYFKLKHVILLYPS